MERICCIVGAGDFTVSLLPARREQYFLLAADGGYAALQKDGLQPDLCVGDFDSLGFVPGDCAVETLPVEKDETDMAAAALLAQARGFRTLYFFGALGGRRFSHSMAAVQTLLRLHQQGLSVYLFDRNCTLLPACSETVRFPAGLSGDFSLFALSDTAVVSYTGLKYPLEQRTLSNDFPLGVSNSFTGEPAAVQVAGKALIVLEGLAAAQFRQSLPAFADL